MTLFYKATLVAVYLSLYTSTAFTAPKQKTRIAYNSPLFMVVKEKVDEKVSATTTKKAVKPLEEAINGEEVNGSHHNSNNSNLNSAIDLINGNTTNVDIDVVGLVEEINDQIIAGSNELFNNMTNIIEKQLSLVPEDSVANYDISKVLSDVTKDIQNAQKKEIQRQLDEMERLLVRPLEDIAFNDAAILAPQKQKRTEISDLTEEEKRRQVEEHRRELIITGQNSTLLESSRRLKTKEILRNLNVAPFYYSVALLLRWCKKVSAPPLAMLSLLKAAGSIVAGRGRKGVSYSDFIQDGEAMQAGWKKTGEIAAKGNLSRKWAILRRSAEIWAYFSSFYIKEKRMTKMYESGKWSEAKFSEERSKLGAEVTQNLLKLGPTFIKVCINLSKFFYQHQKQILSFRFFRLDKYFPLELILYQKNILNSLKTCKIMYLPFRVI